MQVILTQSLYPDFAVLNSLQAIGLGVLTALLVLQGFQVSGLKDSLSETSDALVKAEAMIRESNALIEGQNTAIANLVHTAQLKNIESNEKVEVIKQDLPAVIRSDHASPATAKDMNAWLEELFL